MATICRRPTESSPTSWSTSISAPTAARRSRAAARIAPRSSTRPAGQLPAEEKVGGDVEAGDEVEFLKDGGDAGRLRGARIGEAGRAALDQHLAAVRLDDAGEDVHQGRFAGAVLAEQRMNFAALEIEVDAAQGLHAAKALDDAAHRQKRGGDRCGHVHEALDPRRDGF